MKVSVEKLQTFLKIIEEEQLNEYIKNKISIVSLAIEEILKGQENKKTITLPQKIDFQNFLQVLGFFFGNKDINQLNSYGIYFVINFLKCCDSNTFENISFEDVREAVSKEKLEELIGDGEKWEKQNTKKDLIRLGLEEQLEKYGLN